MFWVPSLCHFTLVTPKKKKGHEGEDPKSDRKAAVAEESRPGPGAEPTPKTDSLTHFTVEETQMTSKPGNVLNTISKHRNDNENNQMPLHAHHMSKLLKVL